jgi:hypothetical protein
MKTFQKCCYIQKIEYETNIKMLTKWEKGFRRPLTRWTNYKKYEAGTCQET